MSAVVSAIRKSLKPAKMEDHVRNYNESEPDSEKKRQALWGIRDLAEKRQKVDELLRLGVIPIMVKTIYEEKRDERLWALWVIRFLADNETAATLILQEPNAIEALVAAIKEANIGSEAAKRSVEAVLGLSRYLSTQILLAREDVFIALTAAMGSSPPEASAALAVYCGLADLSSGRAPPYIGQMARKETFKYLKNISENPKMSPSDRETAMKLYEYLEKNKPLIEE